jgi:hypothetical protein
VIQTNSLGIKKITITSCTQVLGDADMEICTAYICINMVNLSLLLMEQFGCVTNCSTKYKLALTMIFCFKEFCNEKRNTNIRIILQDTN